MHFTAFAAPPAAASCSIAARLHSNRQCFGSSETAEEERDQQRTNFHSTLDEVTLVEAHSACRLSFNEALDLGDKNRYELKSDYKDHHDIVYWQSNPL